MAVKVTVISKKILLKTEIEDSSIAVIRMDQLVVNKFGFDKFEIDNFGYHRLNHH
jgi:hypothetical protein